MKKTQGFTLIELLVVIAIIGILSSVVLASLNTARNKGADAAIKSALTNLRSQAEVYYDNQSPNSYGAAQAYSASGCSGSAGTGVFSDTTVRNILGSALNSAGQTAAPCLVIAASGSTPAAYAVAVQLKANSGYYACVDSTGAATTTSSLTIGSADASCL